jgi:hypothetical protein
MFTWKAGKVAWVLALALVYGLFILWYGGQRAPVTAAEGEAFLARMLANPQSDFASEHPEFPGNIRRLVAQDDGREFFMINLETAKPGPEAEAANAAYSRIVLPLLLKRGSFPLFVSQPVGPVFGNFGAGIDRVAIVRYRSLYDLLDMSADPEMRQGGPQKFLALAHTEVLATRPVINAFQVRIFLGLAFMLLGAAGWWILSRLERRRA